MNPFESGGRNYLLNSDVMVDFEEQDIIPTTVGEYFPQNIEAGGRNLLLKSGEEVGQRGPVRIFSNLVVGEEYTFQVEYEIVKGTPSSFLLYLNGSGNYWVQAPITDRPIGKTKVTFIPPNENVVPNLNLYTGYNNAESQTVTVRFKNMKLERGNIATDWTPAPEDIPLMIPGYRFISSLNDAGIESIEESNLYDLSHVSTTIKNYGENQIVAKFVPGEEVVIYPGRVAKVFGIARTSSVTLRVEHTAKLEILMSEINQRKINKKLINRLFTKTPALVDNITQMLDTEIMIHGRSVLPNFEGMDASFKDFSSSGSGSVTYDISAGRDLFVLRNSQISGNLNVGGDSQISGDSQVSGNLNVDEKITSLGIQAGTDGIQSEGKIYSEGHEVAKIKDVPTTALNSEKLGGKDPNYYRGGPDTNHIVFTVNGNANTYYPVRIGDAAHYKYSTYSISRFYSAPAPDSWNTPIHKGGLTFTFMWSGDNAWGGNHKPLRVIEFGERYTTMVAGMQLTVSGLIVWLRGGGADYTLHSDAGVNASVTVTLGTYISADNNTWPVRTNTSMVASEIHNKWPIRGSGDLYNNGVRVARSDELTWNSIASKPTTATRWPTWSEVSGKPNIADYVVEEGTNYRKWNSGRLEQWGWMGTNAVYQSAWGGFHYYTFSLGDYPIAFKEMPHRIFSAHGTGQLWMHIDYSPTTTTNPGEVRSLHISSARTDWLNFHYYAVGKWK